MPQDLSAGERVYRTIRDRIVSLQLAPNTAISEVQLARLLGVSRTPVREALMRLSTEGLVDLRSRAGTMVAPIRLAAVRNAQFVRERLEVAIIEEAARVCSDKVRFQIRQVIDEQRFAIDHNDMALFFASDERMHQIFTIMVGRPLVWSVIGDAKKHMDRVRWLSLEKMDLDLLLQDHLEILGAIEQRSPQQAHKAMERHLRRVMRQLDELMSVYPS